MTAAYVAVTATGAITSIPTVVHGFILENNSNAVNVTLTDGNGGATICKLYSTTTVGQHTVMLPVPIYCQNGVYATFSAANGTLTMIYS